MNAEDAASGGIQSLDAALRLLTVLAEAGHATSLSDLARLCEMPPSKVHRYLSSFLHAGFVTQTARSGRYDLGPKAMLLGLSAIARHDFVNETADHLEELARTTGMTALLSVWGSEGATVIRWERAATPTVTSMGLGTTMPLLNSATGRAFLGWGPRAAIETVLNRELARLRKMPSVAPDLEPTQKSVESLRMRLQELGYASVDGSFIPGLVAIAAPILDWQHQAQAVVSLIGTNPESVAQGSAETGALLNFAHKHSRLLPA